MAIVYKEWLNSNELRSYPLHDKATGVSNGGLALPHDILVDANIWVPRTLGRFVFVSSVGVSSSLVSLTFSVTDVSPFCDVPVIFTPIAVVSIRKPVIRFKNYAIQALIDGVGGWIALGQGCEEQTSLSLLFSTPVQSLLVDRAVRTYAPPPISSIGKIIVTPPLQGVVRLQGSQGTVRTYGGTAVIDSETYQVGYIGLDTSVNEVEILTAYAARCGVRPITGGCKAKPLVAINGVAPDVDGNIDIEFTGAQQIGDSGDGLILDHPVGLSMVCPDSEKYKLVLEGKASCGSGIPYPLVEIPGGTPEPPEGHGDDFSSGISSSGGLTSGGSVCEDFQTGSLNELVAVKGDWTIDRVDRDAAPSYVTNRLSLYSANLALQEQMMLNTSRVFNIDTGYTVQVTLNPYSSSGEGHIVFGYANANNYFMLGVKTSHTLVPNGMFFIAKRLNVAGAGSQGFSIGEGDYYTPIINNIAISSTEPLRDTDYTIVATFYRIAGTVVVDFSVSWVNTNFVPRTASYSIAIPTSVSRWTPANDTGYVGLGVFGSTTSFDDFCINASPTAPTCLVDEDFSIVSGDFSPELEPVCGSWLVSSGRYITNPATEACEGDYVAAGVTEVFIADPEVVNEAGFVMSGKIRPTNGQKDGGFVFNYIDETNFMAFGIDRTGTPGFGSGCFYFIQKMGFGRGGGGDVRFAPGFPLPETDYTVTLSVSRIYDSGLGTAYTPYVRVAARVEWNDGTTQRSKWYSTYMMMGTLSYVNNSSYISQKFRFGLLARSSRVEFDDICVRAIPAAVADCTFVPAGPVITPTFTGSIPSMWYGPVPAGSTYNTGGFNALFPERMPMYQGVYIMRIQRNIHTDITFAQAGRITGGFILGISMTASQVGDLHIVLTSPAGTKITVLYRPGSVAGAAGSQLPLTGDLSMDSTGLYKFAEAGTAFPLTTPASPGVVYQRYAGDWPGNTVVPIGSFSDFTGECVEGDWTLEVYDWELENKATVRQFSITCSIE